MNSPRGGELDDDVLASRRADADCLLGEPDIPTLMEARPGVGWPWLEAPEASPDVHTVFPVRRAMRARTAESHLISSSSLAAHRRSGRFGVTILNV